MRYSALSQNGYGDFPKNAVGNGSDSPTYPIGSAQCFCSALSGLLDGVISQHILQDCLNACPHKVGRQCNSC
eukprot:3739162-Amphidinium_carterae.1